MTRGPLIAVTILLGGLGLIVGVLISHNFARNASPPVEATRPVAVADAIEPGPPLGRDRVAASPAPAPAGTTAPLRTLLNIRTPMRYGQFVWNDDKVPVGPVWVRVDLGQQLVSVFRGGHEIGTSVILFGADKMPTPIGSFPILAMMKDHRSSLYDAPMPYTLRLTNDGVAIHGSNVRWGAATHGCIGVPKDFAAKLFETANVGDNVTIVAA